MHTHTRVDAGVQRRVTVFLMPTGASVGADLSKKCFFGCRSLLKPTIVENPKSTTLKCSGQSHSIIPSCLRIWQNDAIRIRGNSAYHGVTSNSEIKVWTCLACVVVGALRMVLSRVVRGRSVDALP